MKMKEIVITGLCMTSGIISAQTKLSFNAEVGSKYEYSNEYILNVDQGGLLVEEKVSTLYLMNIMNKNSEETLVQFTYQNISFLQSSSMMQIKYDSKKAANNPTGIDKMYSKIFSSVVGKTFSASIAADGSVNSLAGIDAITEDITHTMSADGEMGEHLCASLIKQYFNEKVIKGVIESSLKIYPADKVKVGDSWTIENTFGGVSNMNETAQIGHTLKKIKNDVATIDFEAAIEVEQGGGLEGKLNGTQSGTILVNTKTGMPVSSNLTQKVKGSITQHLSITIDMMMLMTAKIKTSFKEID